MFFALVFVQFNPIQFYSQQKSFVRFMALQNISQYRIIYLIFLLCCDGHWFELTSFPPLFNLQVLQGGGLESPTKPKGRPKKNSIPSSEQLSEQERSAADTDQQSEGSSSHLENTQEEWWGPSLHMLGFHAHKLCDAFSAGTRPPVWHRGDVCWCSVQKPRTVWCSILRRPCVFVVALPLVPSWWTCRSKGGNSNFCSRSNLYILRIRSHSSVLCSFLCNYTMFNY